MGGEDQLKALIRQSFSLQNTADKAVLDVDRVLAQSMANVKRWVEQLPEESLLRAQAWKELEPFVKQELEVYSNQLGSSIENALVDAEPGMERDAIRQAQLAGADFGPETISLNPPGGGVQKSVEMALNSRVNNITVQRLFNLDGKGSGSVFDKALFKTVDTRVRGGMIQGLPTQEIANLMAQDVQRAGVPGVNLNAEAVKTIRSQSMAMARTATQDMARQVKDEVYDANADAMEGMEWQWSTALDSRTCEQCSPLDGRRWKDKKDVPQWPLHPNCRCQALPIDPEDPFWNEKTVNAQVIRPVEKGPYKGDGAYKTPVKINGKKFYRKAVTVTSDTPPPNYSDTLAYWAKNSQTSLKEAMGPSRAAWFTKEYNRINRDPQQILQAMLTGKPGAQKWIPVEQLNKKTVKLPKPKAKPNQGVVESLTIDTRGTGNDNIASLRNFDDANYNPKTPLKSYKTQVIDGMALMAAKDPKLAERLLSNVDDFATSFSSTNKAMRTIKNASLPKTIEKAKQEFLQSYERLEAALSSGTSAANDYRNTLLSNIKKSTLDDIEKKVKILGGTRDQKRIAKESLREFAQMFNGNGIPFIRQIKFDKATPGAAFDIRKGLITVSRTNISNKDLKNILFHEMGHSLEKQSPDVLRNAIAWRNSRATSARDGVERFGSQLLYRYVKDKFFDTYVGRKYDFLGEDATEVISTGIEMFARPDTMIELLARDPEHFFLINSLTRRPFTP